MRSVFLSIGSNVHPEKNVPACLQLLKETFLLKQVSSIYETEPVGPAGDKKFWNLAVEIETPLSPRDFLSALRAIEEKLGRERSPDNKFMPRTIDLDILPLPDYDKHAFIMVPLAEIAPGERDEKSGKTFREIAKPLAEKMAGIKRIKPGAPS